MGMEYSTVLDLLCGSGAVVELRAITDDGMASGYFSDYAAFGKAAAYLDGLSQTHGVYLTLNEVNPALLARRANRVKHRLGKKDSTTADGDIIRRRWLPIDIDPVRPSGVSSTDAEHGAALDRAEKVAGFLHELGWPDPIIGDSGNGAHLLYRIDVPSDAPSRELVKDCLFVLTRLFSDSQANVDTANFNAGRIWKLYGTVSRKGDHTDERPHRRSGLVRVPDEIRMVPADLLQSLASLKPDGDEHQPGPGRQGPAGTVINLGEWLTAHGLGYEQKPYAGGDLFVLDECPFSGAHKDGAYAIQFSSGAVYAGCHHDSCGGGMQRWQELREKFDGKRSRPAGAGKGRSKVAVKREMLADARSAPLSPDTIAEAARILRDGDPVRYMLDAFALDHVGDQIVAECMVMSLASRSVLNSKGLHVSVTGESGKGKSHAFGTMLRLVPPDLRLDGRMSDKALFYIEAIKAGSVIALDDTALSEQMSEILKGVTTSFAEPFKYHTVSKDRKGQECRIPERCVWWVAKVEGAGDDQVFNRMLTCWIDDSEEQDSRVLSRTLADCESMPVARPLTRREIEVCREMWKALGSAWVVVPFGTRIRISSAANRRNPDMLIDLIRAYAVLYQMQRRREVVDGMPVIFAERSDFDRAASLYERLNGEAGGQSTKLTRREAALIKAIRETGYSEITVTQMQQATGWSNSSIYKLLHGYMSRGVTYSGLLEKCPAISFSDRTVVCDAEGATTHRRTRAYTWDEVLYDSWGKAGVVWLEEEESGPGGSPDPDGDGGDFCRFLHVADLPRSQTNDDSSDECLSEEDKRILSERAEKDESTEKGQGDGNSSSLCSRLQQTQDHDPGCGPICLSDQKKSGDIESGDSPPPAELVQKFRHPLPLSHVRVRDFKRIDGFGERGPCDVCDGKYVHYIERMTKERQKTKRKAFRMCRTCYARAQQREAARCIALPGLIKMAGMKRWSVALGRCHLCDTGPIVWFDPVEHFGLCETCYARECSGVGGASERSERATSMG